MNLVGLHLREKLEFGLRMGLDDHWDLCVALMCQSPVVFLAHLERVSLFERQCILHVIVN